MANALIILRATGPLPVQAQFKAPADGPVVLLVSGGMDYDDRRVSARCPGRDRWRECRRGGHVYQRGEFASHARAGNVSDAAELRFACGEPVRYWEHHRRRERFL